MLSSKGLERGLHNAIAAEGAGKVHQDTLIILDPSDVQKPYEKKMGHIAKVWDGSDSALRHAKSSLERLADAPRAIDRYP